MSMIGNFFAITPDQLKALQAEPDGVEALIYAEDGPDPDRQLDVDKAWHAIHFLLTGSTWEGDAPYALAVLGGTEIGEDVGYGPARYLLPAQVADIASALAGTSAQELGGRFDPDAMDAAEIYPQIWRDDDPADALGYVLENYKALVAFYQSAAARGDALLLYIN